MDFEFSDDQEQLRASVRRFLHEKSTLPDVRRQIESSALHRNTDEVWLGLATIGLTGMLIPERFGGAGMGMVDLAPGLGEMGRSVYPGPFPGSAIGAAVALTTMGDEEACARWLPGIASGATVAALAPTGAPDSPVTITADDRLTGTLVHVLGAPEADLFVVAATSRAGPAVALVSADEPGVTIRTVETVDPTRRFGHVDLAGVRATQLTGDATAAITAATDALGVAMVLDGIGAAERALELTVEYAKTREQFGRPIGSFQAVQHLCADMLRALELGRAAGYYAAWACDDATPEERHRAATMARAFAADGFYRVAATAIQVFGGVGFTWEHDIHLYYKRLLTLQLFGGTAADHLEELATLVL